MTPIIVHSACDGFHHVVPSQAAFVLAGRTSVRHVDVSNHATSLILTHPFPSWDFMSPCSSLSRPASCTTCCMHGNEHPGCGSMGCQAATPCASCSLGLDPTGCTAALYSCCMVSAVSLASITAQEGLPLHRRLAKRANARIVTQDDGARGGEEPAESRVRDSTLQDLLASSRPAAVDGGPIIDDSILAELQERVRRLGLGSR